MMNPLLEPSKHDQGALPFDQIRFEHFEPAFDASLSEARARLKSIRENKAGPTFDNTIEALECASEALDKVSSVFNNLLSANTSPELQSLAQRVLPRLAEFSNDVYLDPGLFARVQKVRESVESLDRERARLLEKTYLTFVRNGAKLDESKKARIREIDSRMATLDQTFSDHLLKDTNSFELVLETEDDLKGLPEAVRQAAGETAKERGKPGKHVITLHQPSLLPFLMFSERRDLRERLWRANLSRGTQGETDNRPLIIEITRLRKERAGLMGHETHAHFVLEERMAATPARVAQFLERIRKASYPAAQKDLEELTAFAGHELKPWDFMFYSERLKKKKVGIDDEMLRPYFQLENVINGVFEHARRLYGLEFKVRDDLPRYHPEVVVYEVNQAGSGEVLGIFYADFHPRASKRGGAWMTTYREQGLMNGQVQRPLVSIVCNLTRSTPTQPSLLNLDEVRTVFHEFGHALHSLLSKCRYRSLSGPNVYWDFVELPSQIMENWVKEKEGLDLFAKHYKTGASLPQDWMKKVQEAEKFQSGWYSLRQVALALLDMGWHTGQTDGVTDVEKHERAVTASATLFAPVSGAMISPSFSHIFSGGYSAGYYSYKWAEVLDADAFEVFKEKGLFNSSVALSFRTHILEKGGSEHPLELYKRFRGREPDPDALLRRDGLL